MTVSAAIQDASSLIDLLLSPASSGCGQWRAGALESASGTIDPAALADLVTLDVLSRPDLDLYFGREDLTGTLAASFDHPDPTWAEVLDSFFTLWGRHAFSVNLDTHAHRAEVTEGPAVSVLRGLQERLALVSA